MNNDLRGLLDDGFTEPIRDPLWGHVYLTPELAALTRSAAFMRLARIFQLGPAYTVYPGATHTRAAHSIGVYHLARRLLRALAERGADAWISAPGARSFLAAALLHDLGHFPYTHSLKDLPLTDHESLTGRIILAEPLKSLVAATGADPYRTAAIVDTRLPVAEDGETTFYRRLLSGVLDPDKLDYLNRDARYCGVPYGAQDVDFTFSRLIPHPQRGVDIDSRAIPAVEAILFAKYLMYRSVYWHRSVRSATAMIKKALKAGLDAGAIQGEDLYGLDDQGLFSLLAKLDYPQAGLGALVRSGSLYLTVGEVPFDPVTYSAWENLDHRSTLEAAVAQNLSSVLNRRIREIEIIVDVPEPVSFETGLFVADEGVYFSASSTVFAPATVTAFVSALRRVRIFMPESIARALENAPKAREILQSPDKWLHF